MSAEQSTFMINVKKEREKVNRAILFFTVGQLVGVLIILTCLFLIKGCEIELPEPVRPVQAVEVSIPAIYHEPENQFMTQEEECAYLGQGCTPAQIAEGEKDMRIYRVQEEIKKQADEYVVDQDTALAIAECESQFDMYAKNASSTAKGVYQFTDPTWKFIKASGHQFDYKENVKNFMIWYQVYPGWWSECLAKTGL